MSGPYFQKQSWPDFEYNGTTYSLTHLDEYQFEVTDSTGVVRGVVVTFSDHCFTRERLPTDDAALLYPHSSRAGGCFCPERHGHSLNLRQHIAQAATREVWLLSGDDRYAIVPTVDHQGNRTLYGIVFSLDPVKGLPVHLHLRVRSAHPRDDRDIDTHGSVKFTHLVTLRIQNRHPKKRFERDRKRPRLT